MTAAGRSSDYPRGGAVTAVFAGLLAAAAAYFFLVDPAELAATAAGEQLPGALADVWNGCFLVGGLAAVAGHLWRRRLALLEGFGLSLSSLAALIYTIAVIQTRGIVATYLVIFASLAATVFAWRMVLVYRHALRDGGRG